MKRLQLLFALFFSVALFAQNINQLDANGKRHGKWKKFYDKTKVPRYEGEFNHGKEIGTFKYYVNHNNKPLLKATKLFNANNNIAEVTFYNEKGNIVSKGKMNGKKYTGKWLYYHLNSKQVMTEENYNEKGLLEGQRKVFYSKGQLAEETIYKNGKQEGLAKNFSETGKLIKESHYKNGMLNGILKAYDSNGKVTVEGLYKNDKKHGIWKFYKNGKLVKKTDFTKKSKNPYKNKKK